MNWNLLELWCGAASTMLYLGWGAGAAFSPEPYRAAMLWFYACANVAILWPVIGRALR